MTQQTVEQGRGVGGTNSRAAALLAWSLAGLTLAMFVATIPLWFLARGADLPSSWGPISALEVWWEEHSFWPSRWWVH